MTEKEPVRIYQLRDVPIEIWDAWTAESERMNLPRRDVVLNALRWYLGIPEPKS
jgi:hypothetical protein